MSSTHFALIVSVIAILALVYSWVKEYQEKSKVLEAIEELVNNLVEVSELLDKQLARNEKAFVLGYLNQKDWGSQDMVSAIASGGLREKWKNCVEFLDELDNGNVKADVSEVLDQSIELISEQDVANHFIYLEDESSKERNQELQEQGCVKYKGKWYQPVQEDSI
jgi:hypothetical protein